MDTDIDIARFIKEEVREVVKEVVRAASIAPPVYGSHDASPESAPAKKEIDIEAPPASTEKDVAKPKSIVRRRFAHVMIWLPVVVWIVAVAVLSGMKVLPYDIVPLAAIFMAVADGSLIFFAIVRPSLLYLSRHESLIACVRLDHFH